MNENRIDIMLNAQIKYSEKLWKENDDLQQENKQLKERIDKAIEYIKKNYYEIVYETKGTMPNDLLEILGDKE